MDEETALEVLRARYDRHVYEVEHNELATRGLRTWHVACARGLRKLIVEVAMAAGDDETLNHVWGAPHWLTFSDEQVAKRD